MAPCGKVNCDLLAVSDGKDLDVVDVYVVTAVGAQYPWRHQRATADRCG